MGTITVNLQGNGGQSDSFDWSVLSTTQLHRDHPYITSSNSTCTSLQYTSNIYFKEKYLQQAGAELCQAQEKLGLAKSDLSSNFFWLSSLCLGHFGIYMHKKNIVHNEKNVFTFLH